MRKQISHEEIWFGDREVARKFFAEGDCLVFIGGWNVSKKRGLTRTDWENIEGVVIYTYMYIYIYIYIYILYIYIYITV